MEGCVLGRDCGALGGLFQAVINDMKGSFPMWEDFISKGAKLHAQLRATVLAVSSFMESFQKLADMATNSRGASRDIGSALTRLCTKHRNTEHKLRLLTGALLDGLVAPLQERVDEWRRTGNNLDKEHSKESKRARQELKRKSLDTVKLQKKAKRESFAIGKGEWQAQLEVAQLEVSEASALLHEVEKGAARRALVEERARYCGFVYMLRSVVVQEVYMLEEAQHLHDILEDLDRLTSDPHELPASSEQVIVDLKVTECSLNLLSPPASPTSSKSSIGSNRPPPPPALSIPPIPDGHSAISLTSTDSRSGSSQHSHSPTPRPPAVSTAVAAATQERGITTTDAVKASAKIPRHGGGSVGIAADSSSAAAMIHEGGSGSLGRNAVRAGTNTSSGSFGRTASGGGATASSACTSSACTTKLATIRRTPSIKHFGSLRASCGELLPIETPVVPTASAKLPPQPQPQLPGVAGVRQLRFGRSCSSYEFSHHHHHHQHHHQHLEQQQQQLGHLEEFSHQLHHHQQQHHLEQQQQHLNIRKQQQQQLLGHLEEEEGVGGEARRYAEMVRLRAITPDPTADILAQIRQGVKLRKTSSGDQL
ncbi:unnamed protein product [Lampetra fluviatilis]